MRIFLWGMPGSGKSSLGKAMAGHFQKIPNFIDLDTEIEKHSGQTIDKLFATRGEEFFRYMEHQTLKEIIASQDNFIMATGGGTPIYHNNYQLMYDNGLTIYLIAPVDLLAARLFPEKDKRPLLKNFSTQKELENYLEQLLKEREPYYRMAHVYWDISRPELELIKMIKIMLGCDAG